MPEPESPRVGVVILNWKRPEDTLACLRSLERLDYPAVDIVVVDNGSDAEAQRRIRATFPRVELVANARNLGFAAGSNVGMGHVLGRGAEYVLLLNDDTEVAPDMLRQLVQVGESRTDIGVLGPTIYYHAPPGNVIWSAGGTVTRTGETSHRRLGESDATPMVPAAPQDVDYVTGCAMLMKRQVIEAIGTLDTRFFAYFEETEWCARARRAGYRVVHVPSARMWHKLEPMDRPNSPLYVYLSTRNRLLYLASTRANAAVLLSAILDVLRAALSPFVRPARKDRRRFSGIILRALLNFVLGRFGPPPARL